MVTKEELKKVIHRALLSMTDREIDEFAGWEELNLPPLERDEYHGKGYNDWSYVEQLLNPLTREFQWEGPLDIDYLVEKVLEAVTASP